MNTQYSVNLFYFTCFTFYSWQTIYDCDIKVLCKVFLKVSQTQEIQEIEIL